MRLANKVFVFFEKASRRGWSLSPSPPLPFVFGEFPSSSSRQTLAASEARRGALATWRSVWTQVMEVLGNAYCPKLKHGWTRHEEAAFKARSQHYGRPEEEEESDFIRTLSFDLPKLLESKAGGPILGPEYNCGNHGSGETDELCPMVEMEMDRASGKLPKPSLPETKPKPECHDAAAKGLTRMRDGEITSMVCCYLTSKYAPYHVCNPTDFYPNIASFDFNEESTVGLGPPLHKITPSKMAWIEDSVNVISLKVLKSDVGYPISIYGTFLARDQIDRRCVYLFRRDRDNPQVITSSDDMLILTGPNRGLAVTGSMLFELNLKIKDGGTVDKDFSKWMFEHVVFYNDRQPMICVRTSHMSTVEFVYTHVEAAVEASVEVNFCNELRNFSGKVTAWTTQDVENHIILYDSEAAGAVTSTVDNDGSLLLSRCLVAVPLYDELVLDIYILHEDKHLVLNFGQSDQARVCNLGSYELQVKVTWTGGMVGRRYVRMKVA